MNSEIQISLKFQQYAYVYLKEYPNRALLGRAKIITFHKNETLFQQRCSLFLQLCCLLFRIQMQKSDVFVSKNVFIDYNHLIFMLYSYDKSHEGKLKRISHGNFINNILLFYGMIFLRQIVKINDYQHNSIYENMQEIINNLFELKDKSEQGYYQQSKQISSSIESEEMLINSPISIMKKLKNSHLFSNYFYLLKVNRAIIINVLLTESGNQNLNDLHYIYSEISHIQKTLFKLVKKSEFLEDVKDSIFLYQKNFIELLKLIQHQNYITLYKIQDQNRPKNIYNFNVLDLEIYSNFRKLPSCPRTAGQRSTQSSVCEDNESGTKEEKEEKKRQRDLFQTIKRFENEINFRIEVSCNLEKRYFVIEVEGVSQWCLDQSLYSHLYDMWTEFGNSWHNQQLENNQEIVQYLKPFKLQMLQRNRNIIIRQIFKVQQGCSLTLQILSLIDKITMAFLLLEKNLKHLYKVTHNIMLNNQQYYKNIKNREYISNIVKLHKQALRMYSGLYNQLNSQEKHYYK